MVRPYAGCAAVALPCCCIVLLLLVGPLLLEEFGDGINVDEINNGKDELGLPAGHSLPIRKQLTPLILDIILKLPHSIFTAVNGEKASPLALGVL